MHATNYATRSTYPTLQGAFPIYNFLIEKLETIGSKQVDQTIKLAGQAALEKIKNYFDLADSLAYDIAIGKTVLLLTHFNLNKS